MSIKICEDCIEFYSIKNETFFKVGGVLDVLFEPRDIEALARYLKECGLDKITILGNCSNVLIRDSGIRGLTIRLRKIRHIKEGGEFLIVGAGCTNNELSKYAVENGISGLEFLAGIPGSVGGGVKMNAGCFGREFKDIVESVTICDFKGGVRRLTTAEAGFSYRSCSIPDDSIIVEAAVKNELGDKNAIREKIKSILVGKGARQPYGKTCGSTFKNGKNYSAGQLIDSIGLKGAKVGGAYVSEKHANFIMNDGSATALDIEKLIKLIHNEVLKNTGISMDLEIKILGEGN